MSALFSDAKLIVIKVGSALLVDSGTGELRRAWLESRRRLLNRWTSTSWNPRKSL